MRVPAKQFSLRHTLASGQLFRYEPVGEGYLVAHRDIAFVVSQEGEELVVHYATPGVTPELLTEFFALIEHPPKPVDDYSAKAIAFCDGMRVCRQDPWECTIGFICSQNNNVPRIRGIMMGLAQTFGKPLRVGPYTAYAFPNPGDIRAGPALAALKSGYREKYLLAANERLSDHWLDSVRELSYPQAKRWLLTLPGIGPKVADCILLFAYQQKQAFPIDTWVEQFMRTQYKAKTKKQMQQKAEKLFAPHPGIMQQYLFHYARRQKHGLPTRC